VQASKRLLKQAFREQLEQAVKFDNEEFAVRVRSDEAKEVFRAFFTKRQRASHPA
jgi:enoyl-CoA hydratase/carnithine racemase